MEIKKQKKVRPLHIRKDQQGHKESTSGRLYRNFALQRRRKFLNIGLILITLVMLFSPGVKTWVLQNLMKTGLFNARIRPKSIIPSTQNPKSDAPFLGAPDFTFQNEQGQNIQLRTLQGKVVFINLWATWCPPCRAELPTIEKLARHFKGNKDVVFLMLNEDNSKDYSEGKVQAFLDKNGYALPIYRLMSGRPDFFKGTLPTTVVLDKKGRIRFKKEGAGNFAGEGFIKDITALINE